MDDEARAEATTWMSKSRRDLDSAARLFEGLPPYRDTAAYHCQQSAEKALKAYLTATATSFPKTHDLVLLLELASKSSPELARLSEAAVVLTPYSTLYRYPDSSGEPDDADVREALSFAEAVYAAVADRLRASG